MKWSAQNKWFRQIRNNRLFYQSFLLMSVIEAEFMGAVMIKEVSYECILNESYTQLSFSNHQQFVSASELHTIRS